VRRYHLYFGLPARHGKPVAEVTTRCPGQPPPVPHVTLVGPAEIVADQREPELLAALRTIARSFAPLPLRYDGVTFFAHKRCICIRVVPTPELVSCQKALALAARRFLKPSYQSGFRYRPHITLAARLFPWEGEVIWRALRHRPFEGTFLGRQILLMRQEGPDAPWQRLTRLRLAGTPADEPPDTAAPSG
jgi:2'-5' RNA ligase